MEMGGGDLLGQTISLNGYMRVREDSPDKQTPYSYLSGDTLIICLAVSRTQLKLVIKMAANRFHV
jgi:hypothetical protein